jgi:hypothetical protein
MPRENRTLVDTNYFPTRQANHFPRTVRMSYLQGLKNHDQSLLDHPARRGRRWPWVGYSGTIYRFLVWFLRLVNARSNCASSTQYSINTGAASNGCCNKERCIIQSKLRYVISTLRLIFPGVNVSLYRATDLLLSQGCLYFTPSLASGSDVYLVPLRDALKTCYKHRHPRL